MQNKLYLKRTLILLVSSLIFLSGLDPGEDPDQRLKEAIRLKIENLEIQNPGESQDRILAIPSIRMLYTENDFEPFWFKEKEIRQFLTEIGDAENEGLNPSDYHLNRLRELTKNGELTMAGQAELEILLTDAFLLYASHLLSGKVDPLNIDADWHVTHREGDPVELFLKTIKSNQFNEAIHRLIPESEGYKQLKEKLRFYRKIYGYGGWEAIPAGKTIEPGMKDPRIQLIRHRLGLEAYLTAAHADSSQLYTPELAAAITGFQRNHGFKGDGKIDEPTITMMNIPVEEKVRQIETNLERWRWLPREFSNYYILVNIAGFELQVVKKGKTERIHRIIAGKPARKTPVFSSQMSYLVLNPTWTIPPTILTQDVLPEVRKSTRYLHEKKIRVLNSAGKELNPDSIDWNAAWVRNLTYRQDPGPGNALGVVKFMFPNNFNVYIHDTPSRELFNRQDRAFSSGCIRVDDPLGLAGYLLNDPGKWGTEKLNAMVKEGKPQTIYLKDKPDVHILYWTCWAENDKIQFRKDVYERDKKVFHALKSTPSVVSVNRGISLK